MIRRSTGWNKSFGEDKKKAPGLLKSNANHFYKHETPNRATGGKYPLSRFDVFLLSKNDWRCKDIIFCCMKVIEILNFNRELLKRLQAAGIRLEDARYIDLYADYNPPTRSRWKKVSYAVAVLSEKYSVSERKVYALVKRFQSDCKTLAV